MNMQTEPTTILTNILQHDDFIFALCSFVDAFKISNNKTALIAVPPVAYTHAKENACILAASVHKLANDYGVDVPKWVNDPAYKMPHPVFAFNTTNEEYQRFLLEDTPFEFASKNIFHGANAIERV